LPALPLPGSPGGRVLLPVAVGFAEALEDANLEVVAAGAAGALIGADVTAG